MPIGGVIRPNSVTSTTTMPNQIMLTSESIERRQEHRHQQQQNADRFEDHAHEDGDHDDGQHQSGRRQMQRIDDIQQAVRHAGQIDELGEDEGAEDHDEQRRRGARRLGQGGDPFVRACAGARAAWKSTAAPKAPIPAASVGVKMLP